MRFRALQLRHFKGVESCDVELLPASEESGIVIIEGPNEAGKTSLAQGIRLLWEFPHSSRAREVRDVQPSGHDIGTRIRLQFDHDDLSGTYTKVFNRDASAQLSVRGSRNLDLTGKEAHAYAERLLAEMVDANLWRALQVEQGVVSQAQIRDLPALQAALYGAAAEGAVQVDQRDAVIAENIGKEREKWLTEQGRNRKPLTDQAALVARLQVERHDAAAVLDQVRSDLDEIERLRESLPEQRSATLQTALERAAMGKRLANLEQVQERIRQLEHTVATAQRMAEDSHRRYEERQELMDECEAAEAVLAQPADTADTVAQLNAATDALSHSQTTLAQAAAARENLAAEADRARHLLDCTRADQELESFRALQRRMTQLARIIGASDRVLAAARVDEAVLERLHAAEHQLVRARAAASASAPRVEVTALRDVKLCVDDGDAQQMEAGSELRVDVQSRTVVKIADMATVAVVSGDQTSALQDGVADAMQALQSILDDADVDDVAAAETALHAVRGAQTKKENAIAERAGLLAGRTVEDLQSRMATLREITAKQPDRGSSQALESGETTLFDGEVDVVNVVDVGEAEAAWTRMANELGEAERILGAASRQRELAREEIERLRSAAEQEKIAQQVASAHREQTAARLQRARAVAEDAELTRTANDAQRALEDAIAERSVAARQLQTANIEALKTLYKELGVAVEQATQRLGADEQQLARLEAVVASRSEDGPQARHDAIASRLSLARAEFDRRRMRADAAALLEDVFTHHRLEQRRRYQAPLRDQIERLGRLLWGESLRVELDDDLRVSTRILDGHVLAFEQLSLGAQEQLALIGRLACAIIVGKQGAPLIIDDALGFSDPTRLRRMGAVLSVAGRSCQIVLLTCHPQRYLHVSGARTVRLGQSGATLGEASGTSAAA